MAPEIVVGEGYSFQVDFWSIGKRLVNNSDMHVRISLWERSFR